jgi:hypothetical protein
MIIGPDIPSGQVMSIDDVRRTDSARRGGTGPAVPFTA